MADITRLARVRKALGNWMNHIRIKREAKKYNVHRGTKQILIGGVWEDNEHNIYNCLGQKIGKVIWFEGYES